VGTSLSTLGERDNGGIEERAGFEKPHSLQLYGKEKQWCSVEVLSTSKSKQKLMPVQMPAGWAAARHKDFMWGLAEKKNILDSV
jgi:hypothetical protein